jgi:hypothetical protein
MEDFKSMKSDILGLRNKGLKCEAEKGKELQKIKQNLNVNIKDNNFINNDNNKVDFLKNNESKKLFVKEKNENNEEKKLIDKFLFTQKSNNNNNITNFNNSLPGLNINKSLITFMGSNNNNNLNNNNNNLNLNIPNNLTFQTKLKKY